MKINWAAGLALILGSLPLAAQWVQNPPRSYGIASDGAGASGVGSSPESASGARAAGPLSCPVSLKAQHKADGTMVQTRDAHAKGVGQWLHLMLANPQGRKIAAALITVHGFADHARMTQAAQANTPDARRTMMVPFSSASAQNAEADLWVPDMTAVLSIDLNSVTLEDGGVWSFAGSTGCRISPDPFMLIAGK
jgi:hypothetical protein